MNGQNVKSTAFIQPESEIPCLLGMNILPQLGLKFVQPNGMPLGTETEACQPEKVSTVNVVSSTYLPSHKTTMLEAEISTPFSDGDALMFEPNQEDFEKMGLRLPDALLTQQPNGRVHIPVENSWAVSARLQRGDCLGVVTTCRDLVPDLEQSIAMVSSQAQPVINSVEVSPDRQTQLLEALHLGQSSATAVEIEQLKQLICENADVFALDNSELGHTDVVQHHVHTGDHRPIKQPVRRVPFAYTETIAKMVKEMEETGVIKPSSSPWASPVVLVPKKDGTVRFCIDYRKLNSITKKDVYPLPRIDDILDTLGGTKYFSSLDLASGYWQVSLDSESSAKSAFISHKGLHEFVRMPLGTCNAPATFQRLIEIVLAGLLWKN